MKTFSATKKISWVFYIFIDEKHLTWLFLASQQILKYETVRQFDNVFFFFFKLRYRYVPLPITNYIWTTILSDFSFSSPLWIHECQQSNRETSLQSYRITFYVSWCGVRYHVLFIRQLAAIVVRAVYISRNTD